MKRSMQNRIATIARYTMLEALRTRFAVLALAIIGVTLAGSFFIREIAITESARFQTAFYAASVRFAAVFVAALYAIASVSREFQDKGLDVALALDLPRSHYVLGKLAGLSGDRQRFRRGHGCPARSHSRNRTGGTVGTLICVRARNRRRAEFVLRDHVQHAHAGGELRDGVLRARPRR